MSPARRVNFARRWFDYALDLAGRPLAWGAFAILNLRDMVRPGYWRDDNDREEDDRDE
jgi:hypothetical protein